MKSLSHKVFDKCKHIKLTPKNPDIIKVDNAVSEYIIEHNRKYDCYLIKCDFKLVFKNSEYSRHITFKIFDDRTMISRPSFLEKMIDYFKNNGYTFNLLAEMKIITIANKLDMSYDFYNKHNMHACDWRLNTKCHLLIRKIFLLSPLTNKY